MLTYLTVDGWNTMTAFDDLYASISAATKYSYCRSRIIAIALVL